MKGLELVGQIERQLTYIKLIDANEVSVVFEQHQGQIVSTAG